MDRCPDCGGSGVLRTDAAGYRTCLACVGQGTLPRFEVAGFSSALAAAAEAAEAAAVQAAAGQPATDRPPIRRQRLSAWSSAG